MGMDKDKLLDALAVYVVTDDRPDHDEVMDILRQALMGGATAIQLRRKHEDGKALVELGKKIRRLTKEFHAYYFVNDRIDVALLTNADGVHVGQSDIACSDARALLGLDRWIGVSACTVNEAMQAQRDGADYLGIGSMMPTATKPDADLCSLDELKTIAKAVAIPVVTIGGMTIENAPTMVAAGACGVAVVSAVMRATDPRQATFGIRQAVRQTRRM